MYADQFEIYHGNSNPELSRKICQYLGVDAGKAEVFQFANENIFVRILDNVARRTSSSSSRPATRSTSRSWNC
jgi:phosphoribosylpyrophosphate synthetase